MATRTAAKTRATGDAPLPAPAGGGLELPSASQLSALARRFVRLLYEYGAFFWRGAQDEVRKSAIHAPVTEVDDFGMDPAYRERLFPLTDFLYREYFRVEAIGLENVPAEGRVCLVANHSGAIPYDAAMIAHAVEHEHPRGRVIRSLLDDFYVNAPYLSTALVRSGAVRACQENAERLLEMGQGILLFPEGLKGILKRYRNRYQLQRFGRGGFVRLCLRTRTPIVPVAVIGGEEVHPILFQSDWLRRRLRTFVPPVTLTFPLMGPFGVLPLPAKWTLEFGKPIDVAREFGVRGADDDLGVNLAKEKIRSRIQFMLYEQLKARRHIWIG